MLLLMDLKGMDMNEFEKSKKYDSITVEKKI